MEGGGKKAEIWKVESSRVKRFAPARFYRSEGFLTTNEHGPKSKAEMLKHGKSEIGKAGLRSISRKSGTQEFETGEG
jgi:hypothetical protein